ncbi:hypothetical protein OUZ56_025277 [Daphnia magna]|uniref:Uncharacterized protein n=1 Tax=Daphnia magna TaxID=35525 RepID=A0ABQ9ZJC7_9CRUS|nr:hypothetical protein OUZ56_025277 [Daphnia magna]
MRRHDGQSVERAGWRSQMTEGVGKAPKSSSSFSAGIALLDVQNQSKRKRQGPKVEKFVAENPMGHSYKEDS